MIMGLLFVILGISLVSTASVMLPFLNPIEQPKKAYADFSDVSLDFSSDSSSLLSPPAEKPALAKGLQSSTPLNRIREEDIEVYDDRIIIKVDKPQIARFTDTGSMEPTFGSEANAIEIVPQSPEEIHVGDIVSYYSEIADSTIIHRVIETGYDEKGWYAYFKGDNLLRRDPEKVRFPQIRRLVVMLVY